MVGLSVVLENCRDLSEKRSAQILSKGAMIKPSSPPSFPHFSSALGFLDNCFLCKQKLSPGKDIYMYNGDKAFCSVECRYRQIFMDEEEISTEKSGCTVEYNTCSLAATSSPSTSSSRSGKGGELLHIERLKTSSVFFSDNSALGGNGFMPLLPLFF